MSQIELTVKGQPIPQGSKRAFVNPKTGRAIVTETGGARHKTWRAQVQEAAEVWREDHGKLRLDEPITVRMEFRFDRPKSDPFRTMHAVTPDLDKLIRAVMDSITASGLIRDDALVWRYVCSATYTDDEPGVQVTILPNGDEEATERQWLKDRRKKARSARG